MDFDIQASYPAGPGSRSLIERDEDHEVQRAAQEALEPLLFDPARESFKIEEIAKWATQEGVEGPQAFLKLLGSLNTDHPADRGYALVDRIHRAMHRLSIQRSQEAIANG